jgi:hypothetical protein
MAKNQGLMFDLGKLNTQALQKTKWNWKPTKPLVEMERLYETISNVFNFGPTYIAASRSLVTSTPSTSTCPTNTLVWV